MVLVALAGPGMNLLLAVLGSLVLAATVWTAGGAPVPTALFIAQNAINFVLINIFLAIFNLIPLPPFDGGHVVQGLLPPRAAVSFGKIGRYSLLVFVFLLLVLPMISPSADIVRPDRLADRQRPRRLAARDRRRQPRLMLHGWIILDKPVGLGSTQAVVGGQARAARSRRAQDQGRPRRHARSAGAAACCRSRSARRPSSPAACSTRPRPMTSPSASARRPIRSMAKAR